MADVLDPGSCCLAFPILFFGGIGIMAVFLIWHSLLADMFTRGGTALMALIAFVVLAFLIKKDVQETIS